MKNSIMGIRLGNVILKDITEAAKFAGVSESAIRDAITKGTQTKSGWCFDYVLEENKKNA